jgi:hypothetical protein
VQKILLAAVMKNVGRMTVHEIVLHGFVEIIKYPEPVAFTFPYSGLQRGREFDIL